MRKSGVQLAEGDEQNTNKSSSQFPNDQTNVKKNRKNEIKKSNFYSSDVTFSEYGMRILLENLNEARANAEETKRNLWINLSTEITFPSSFLHLHKKIFRKHIIILTHPPSPASSSTTTTHFFVLISARSTLSKQSKSIWRRNLS